MKSELLMIFVRNPIIGTVKTRLASKIGNKLALKVYNELTRHTASICEKIKTKKKVYYSKEIICNDLWSGLVFQKQLQCEGDLGQRMKTAFDEAFDEGYNKVIIIGSDVYSLSELIIQQAFHELNYHDVVIGPALDGGYYLLGLKMSYPKIFNNKNWGTKSVLKETLHDLKSKSIFFLNPQNDIDDYEDLLKETYLLKKLNINAEYYK